MLPEILVQCIGFTAYLVLAISYFCKKKAQILLWNIVASVILAVHFYFLEGLTGALCNLVGGAAMAAIYFYEKYGGRNKKLLIGLMFPVAALIALFSWQDWSSLLPIAASIILVAGFIFTREQYIRIAGLIGGSLWLIYSLVVGSIPGVICEAFVLIGTVIALVIAQHRTHKLTR